MDLFVTGFVVLILFVGIFSFLIHHYSSSLWVRVAGVIIFVIGVGVSWASLEKMLSNPKPVDIAFLERSAEETTILDMVLIKDQGMYFWVAIKGEKQPRYFVMAWNDELAKKLRKAQEQAKGQKTKIKVKGFLHSLLKDGTPQNKEKVEDIVVPAGEMKPEQPTREVIKRGFGLVPDKDMSVPPIER